MKKNFKRTLAFLLTFTMLVSCLILNFSITTSANEIQSRVLFDFEGETLPVNVATSYSSRITRTLNTDTAYAKDTQSLKITVKKIATINNNNIYMTYTHADSYNGISFWVKAQTAVIFYVQLENINDTTQKKSYQTIALGAGEEREITLMYEDDDSTFVPGTGTRANRIRFWSSSTKEGSDRTYYVDNICEIKKTISDTPDEITETIADFESEDGNGDKSQALTGTTGYHSEVDPTFDITDDPRAGATGKALEVTVPTTTDKNKIVSCTTFNYTAKTGYDGISFWIKANTAITMDVRIYKGEQQNYILKRISLAAGEEQEVRARYEDATLPVLLGNPLGNVVSPSYSIEGKYMYVQFYVYASTSEAQSYILDDIKQYKQISDNIQQPTGATIDRFVTGTGTAKTSQHDSVTTAPVLEPVTDPRDPNGNSLKVTLPAVDAEDPNVHSAVQFGYFKTGGPYGTYEGLSFWIVADQDMEFEIRFSRGSATASTSTFTYALRRVSVKAGVPQKVTARYVDAKAPASLLGSMGNPVSSMTGYKTTGTTSIYLYMHLYALCGTSEKSYIIDDIEQWNPSFSGASLSLSDDIALNYKVNPADLAGHTDAAVTFTQGDTEQTVTAPTTDVNGRYVYRFDNIDASKINDDITATLKIGETAIATKTYSVSDYCYNMMRKAPGNEKLCNLLADILEYGAKAQLYTENNTENLATANLADDYKTYIARQPEALTPVTTLITATDGVNAPTASWKAVGLNLDDAVNIRLTFATTDAVTKAVVTSTKFPSVVINSSAFQEEGGKYTFLIEDVDASHVRDAFSVVLYNGDTPVSNTITYSIATYADAKIKADENSSLANLMKALIKYGDSVKAYIA